MATSNTDELIPIASPLDLSLKIVNMVKSPKTNDECSGNSTNNDYKSVSSEELLSLKLLHDRLTKTMELLLPQEKPRTYEDIKTASAAVIEKSLPELDYRATMKALLSLVEYENCAPVDEQDKNAQPFILNNPSTPHIDAWSYWHDYILSLSVMNSSLTRSLPPPPPIPPPIPPISITASLFSPPFNCVPPSSNSMFLQNMFSNIINRPLVKPHDNNESKKFLLHETSSPEFGFKSKKLNSYQFLKDSGALYNSFAASRNIGLSKSKLLDSPESFGVSLRGNQKYSIYYQQRPNNIFNNNFLSPTCSSTIPTKSNHSSIYRHSTNNGNHFLHEGNSKKTSGLPDVGQKKSTPVNNGNKIQKFLGRNELESDKTCRIQNSEHGIHSGVSNITYDGVSANIPLSSRARETVFNCSCGQEFENLYSFTIHMKSTHHTPNSSKIERSIPKLVRGQDMWINSETEQTKEILRCMRCHQSFRTLPELTMHMVETNHYSEIVYSDTGKCVYLNSDSNRLKPSYTAINSPISSPGDIIRKLKRSLSSSTGSDIGIEEENGKKQKLSSPIESYQELSVEVEKVVSSPCSTEECTKTGNLQIKEADSGTGDTQPDSDSQCPAKTSKCSNGKETCNSVIRQIENFVEKSLPKSAHNEFNLGSSVFCIANVNHKPSTKSSNKCGASKTGLWKLDSKTVINEKAEAKHKEKNCDTLNSFKYRNYPVSSSESSENPLSSLQTLVETIQKNTSHIKDQLPSNCKTSASQSKDTLPSYTYPSKSPVVCDSLSQLQALVAGTSMNNNGLHSDTVLSKSSEPKLFPSNIDIESSAKFLSWCHRLGELLGLPQALSHAMLTQDAIKELTTSVLQMNSNHHLSLEVNHTVDDDNNNNSHAPESLKIISCPVPESDDPNPIEQLKNLLNSSADTNHSQIVHNKFHRTSSPPTVSKKAKCHFCNKPFANKGQVRLHISKGKCPSLLRSCHSGCNRPDRNSPASSSVTCDTNSVGAHKFKDTVSRDVSDKSECLPNVNNHSRSRSLISQKSVNLIREYFKFAKQMVGNDEHRDNSPNKVESKID